MTDKDCQTASAGNEKAISLGGWQPYKGTITEPERDMFICCLFRNMTIKLTLDYFLCESSDFLKTSALRECARRRTALKARWPCCVVLQQHLHGDAPGMLSKTSCSFQSLLGKQNNWEFSLPQGFSVITHGTVMWAEKMKELIWLSEKHSVCVITEWVLVSQKWELNLRYWRE